MARMKVDLGWRRIGAPFRPLGLQAHAGQSARLERDVQRRKRSRSNTRLHGPGRRGRGGLRERTARTAFLFLRFEWEDRVQPPIGSLCLCGAATVAETHRAQGGFERFVTGQIDDDPVSFIERVVPHDDGVLLLLETGEDFLDFGRGNYRNEVWNCLFGRIETGDRMDHERTINVRTGLQRAVKRFAALGAVRSTRT